MAKAKKDEPVEQRAEDQDTAIEAAFVDGTLPEEDRRTESVADVVPFELVMEPPVDRGPFQGRSIAEIHELPFLSGVENTRPAITRRLIFAAKTETGYAQRAALDALDDLWKDQ